MTTAGNLVFQGRTDGRFVAYNAKSGEVLWNFETGLGISGAPITYQVDGKQFISLSIGWGQARRLAAWLPRSTAGPMASSRGGC